MKNTIFHICFPGVWRSVFIQAPGIPRDFDFIVHLQPSDVTLLMAYFKEGYYWDEAAMKEAIRNQGMFNIIDHKSNIRQISSS